MAKKFLRGNVWWCWGYDVDGNRWQESTHQREPKAATLAAREIERRRAVATPDQVRGSKLTLERALEVVLEGQEAAGRAFKTVQTCEYHAKHLTAVLGLSTRLQDVSLSDTTSYLAKRLAAGAHRHTVAKELIFLAQASKKCAKLGLFVPKVASSHLIPEELGNFYKPRRRWLPRVEYNALLTEIAERQKRWPNTEDRTDYVIAYCYVGVRKTELFDVQPGHYNAERRELFVDGTKTDEASRVVPLSPEANEVFARRCQRDVPFPIWHDVYRDLEMLCERAGIEAVIPNDFRRTFCSWLCQAGVPERVCAELMGHKSTNMVRAVYGHLDMTSMVAAVAKLSVAEGVAKDGVSEGSRREVVLKKTAVKPVKTRKSA